MQTLIFSSQQPSKAKGFSLMELLIYLALAAVFIGGILTLTGKAGTDSDVRVTVQDLSDISNALRSFYGAQRITTTPVAAAMESVAAAALPHMGDGTAGSGNLQTPDGGDIAITPAPVGVVAGSYVWPHYWITYPGLNADTCPGLLSALTGSVAVQVDNAAAPAAAALVILSADDRITNAADIDGHCNTAGAAAPAGYYTVHALYRI